MSETLLILRRIQRDIIINVHRCSCKETLFLSYWNLSTDFRKIIKYKISPKSIRSEQNYSMGRDEGRAGRTDGRTDKQADMTKLIVTFRNFAKAPKIENCVLNDEEGQENRISRPWKFWGEVMKRLSFWCNFVINQIFITQAHIFKSTCITEVKQYFLVPEV
jgi:hypothetical protein